MKKLLVMFALAVMVAVSFSSVGFAEDAKEKEIEKIGFQAPDFEAQLLETRETVKFRELTKGKVTVFLIWTNRNIPGLVLREVFDNLGKRYKDNSDVMVVSHPWFYLNPGDEEMFEGDIGPFSHNVLYVFREQAEKVAKVLKEGGFGVNFVPHVIVIDKKGIIQYSDFAPISERDIFAMIEDLLRE